MNAKCSFYGFEDEPVLDFDNRELGKGHGYWRCAVYDDEPRSFLSAGHFILMFWYGLEIMMIYQAELQVQQLPKILPSNCKWRD